MPGATAVRGGVRAFRRAALLLALLGASSAGLAGAQVSSLATDRYLRLEWTAGEDRRGRPVVTGYVYNERAGSYATSVRLLVEALDASGQVVASTAGFVFGDVPPSNRSYFEVKAPAEAASYRVTVQTFSWRTYGAGGG